MKHFLAIFILLLSFSSFSQVKETFRKYYDDIFPNNKRIQIERLSHKNDSLKRQNDSLKLASQHLGEKINLQKKELEELRYHFNNIQENSKSTLTQLENDVIKLRDSIYSLSFYKIRCKEETFEQRGEEPILKNTCSWRYYKIIETGTPDRRGRYTWKTDIYNNLVDSHAIVTLSSLFKVDSLTALEAKINERIKEEFEYLAETNRHCFPRSMQCPTFALKDMRFVVSDNASVSFEVTFGLSNACYTVDFVSATFKMSELEDYFE